MSYCQALEAAGANVLAFEQFGSYQGDWWALVEHNGKTGWINGSYGSCSGCDAFEAEMGDFYYTSDRENNPMYKQKLAEFGARYLDGLLSQEDAEKQAAKNIEWDCDAQKMVEFVKQTGAKPGKE